MVFERNDARPSIGRVWGVGLLAGACALAGVVSAAAQESPRKDVKMTPAFQLKWVDAPTGPFGVRFLDCRSVTLGMTSMTADKSIAGSYLTLRQSRGEHVFGRAPDGPSKLPGTVSYSIPAALADGVWFSAAQMEDKWDVYAKEGWVYFARSWTGELTYRARFVQTPGSIQLTAVEARTSAESAAHGLRVVDFLMRSHVLDRAVPHPMIQEPGLSDNEHAIRSFGSFGRYAWFGSFDDTLAARSAGTHTETYGRLFGY